MKRLLLTGATGFVGRTLLHRLCRDAIYDPKLITRRPIPGLPGHIEVTHVDDIGPTNNYKEALAGSEVVVHAAARAHRINDRVADPVAEFHRANTEATLNLARQAADAGVKRLVFISTIGVHGTETHDERLTEDSPILPHSPYALSKHEAEIGLRALGQVTGMEIVIIRPPLIYGPDPPGNLARLLALVSRGWPLPFGLVRNKRTLVALDNIVDLIVRCIQHPAAGGKIFLAGDAEDVSTPEIIACVAEGMRTRITQLPISPIALKTGARLLGRPALYQQLCGSLQIDITRARRLLDWTPATTSRDGLIAMGRWYRENVMSKQTSPV
ncbi:MAG: NAD-dependent epimerase/dehydratase family protein [Gammaproteobacteria bacterium]|nr:NAD-dependent epimerase/dehydratase family protein [Gammaproteobacteria bacterium]